MTSSGVSTIMNTLTLVKTQEMGNASDTTQEFGFLLNQKNVDISTAKQPVYSVESHKNPLEETQQLYEKTQTGYKEIDQVKEHLAGDTVTKELEEGFEDLKEEVKNVLMEKLDVTEEELLKAMEALGITFENLLSGAGLKDLVMELTGTEDTMELLFSDTFQNLMQEVDDLVQDFAKQMELTPEETKAFMQLMEAQQPNESMLGESILDEAALTQGMETSVNTENVAEEAVMADADPVEVPLETKGNQTAEMETEPQNQNLVQAADGQGENSASTQGETDTQGDLQQSLKQGVKEELEKLLGTGEENTNTFQTTQTVQTTVNAIGEEIIQTVERTFVDVEDILKQVTEFTRVVVDTSQSSIEMQLNPEHLGKIYLQVASKDGVITAQLAAQNEAVKQALETQVAVLKENMNQQGLKVESVEVTIASHEFEQNLDENQQQAQEEAGKENKKSQRFLSVDQLDQLAGLMSEEETLAAQIMLDNGNSMDMTA